MTDDHKTVVRYVCRQRSGQQRRRRQEARYLWVSLAALAAIVLSHPIAAAPQKEVRRILILNEVNSTYPGISIINQGIQTGLNDSPYHLDFYSEYMDTSLFPDPAVQQEFRDSYIRKYQNRKLDVIITVGPSPLKFMQEVHEGAFPGVPIVFCLPTVGVPGTPTLDSDFTGVENDMAPAETVEIALRLLPGTKNVVVVGGVGPFDRQELANAKQALKGYEGRVDISILSDLAMPDLLERLRHLPSNTVVLLTSVGRDAVGTSFKSNELGPLVAGAANAPVFSLFDVYLNHGEVGGYLSSLSEQGKVAGGMALRILKGAKPRDIPEVKGVNTYMFDWRALKRWGLKESTLPPDSIVINRQPTVWDSYKWYIISGIFLILAEALLIGGLVWQRASQRKAETELAVTYDRLRLAVEASKSVGWEWDVKTGRDSWFGDLQTIFGIPSDTFVGRAEDFYRYVHSDDRQMVANTVAGARQTRKPYAAEFRVVRRDGMLRWVFATGKFYYGTSGDAERMLGIATDITERKRTEQALHESEERLHLAALAGKMFAYEWDAATDKIVRSEGVSQILGLDAGAHTTGQEISKMVPPEDRARLIAAIAQLSPEEPHLRISYRMVRSDGSVIWVERTSRAYFDEHGRMLRTVGMIADITERKRQKAVLRESEERFRLVADTAPTLIWMSGTDKLCTYFNKPWLEFTGRSMDSELGNGWLGGVHPEDLQRCLETFAKSFDRREKFRMEYRLRGYDGEYRWILDIGVPRFNADGSFAGYIGSGIDITERKLAEAALANVSRKLIEAQEQERTRIGRELHDDIGQRLAMLAIAVEQLQQESLAVPAEVRNHVRELQKQISEIAADIQSLSHELHTSKLEYLGIAGAMRGFCREFGEHHKVEIDFTSHDLPSPLSPDASLCLYRVLQEALHNSAKHSGARHFEVRLWGTSEEIHLSVKDSGAGFDREAAKTSRGLGLISMEERLKLVDGTLSINSQPKGGTTIHARVPLGSGSDSMRAAG